MISDANYDAWKTTPPDARESDSDSGYATDCCGAEVADDVGEALRARVVALRKAKGTEMNWTDAELDSVCVICDKCKELSEVVRHEPADPYDASDDCVGGGDGPED